MSDLDVESKKKILARLNVELGKRKENIASVQQRILQDQKEFSINNPKLLEVQNTIQDLEDTLSKIRSAKENFEKLNKEFQEQEKKISPVSTQVQVNVDKINQLEQAKVYLNCLKWLDDLNQELKIEYETPYGLELYSKLCKVTLLLTSSQCLNLSQYSKEICYFWLELFKEKYVPKFEKSLELIKWPFTSSNTSVTQQVPCHENLLKFKKQLKILLQIQYPNILKPDEKNSLLNFPEPCIPIQILLKPLQKRFVFHFVGSKQTNRIDKPEWFLTIILTWIKDHKDFINKHVQPVFFESGHGRALSEFMRGLVTLAAQKLLSDMDSLLADDILFSHTVDEVLGFEKELRDIYCYPQSEPSILQVFCQPTTLTTWIELEGKFARNSMDQMFESETAWDEVQSGDEDMKICECAELFVLLLSTMTERYEALPDIEYKSQFLDLQLELLDEFRLRLIQVMHENEKLVPNILNTVHYLNYILNEWSGLLHFILLQQHRSKSGLGQTVFDEILNLFDRIQNDLKSTILKSALSQIKSKSRQYCYDNWLAKEFNSETDLSFTPSGCFMFKEISTQLHILHKNLVNPLFVNIWETIAENLNTFLIEEIILVNTFSKCGGKQLQFDMTRNLLPIFSQYTIKPERYFSELLEACMLLSLDQVPKNPLNLVKYLSKELCLKILNNRSDMNIKVNIAHIE